MPNIRAVLCVVLSGLGTVQAPIAGAHNVWLLPSTTVLAGEEAWITVDAAVSNDLFYFNHVPLDLAGLSVTAPDGTRLPPENAHTGRYRSVFDLHLGQPGTYRLAVSRGGLFASYELNGEARRWRGSMAEFTTALPAGARNVVLRESQTRVEAFVTLGAPTRDALVPAGAGLELVALTHPNDLYAGERGRFSLLLDGEPAADIEVRVIPGDTRYRDQQGEIVTTTDAEGRFDVVWPHAGRYWLNAVWTDQRTQQSAATERRLTYSATLEVLSL